MYRFLLYLFFSSCTIVALAQSYDVQPVRLNSSGSSSMCPVKYGEGFVYMSNDKAEYIRTVKDGTGNFPFNLHYANRDSTGKVKKTVSFAKELTTLFNDGPLTFFDNDSAMVFSRNLNIEKIGRRNENQKLGLFISFYRNGKWSELESLPFNNEEYNCTHPAISADGSELIFASDRSGGYGGYDLYRAYYKSGSWSTPKNLGSKINTDGNEVFPFLLNNTLFFSTDGRTIDQGLDLFKVFKSDDKWKGLIILDSTINSVADDFGFSSFDNGQQGYFTSNRRNGKDQVYSYKRAYPKPDTCIDNKEIFYCYLLEDYNLLDESDMPLKFQWDMGDGSTMDGYKVIHCYDTLGTYQAKLNVVDTVFNETYAAVTEVEVVISAEDSPYMLVPDTLAPQAMFKAQIDLRYCSQTPEIVYWKVNDVFVLEGRSVDLFSGDLDSVVVTMVWQMPSGITTCMNKVVYIKSGFVNKQVLIDAYPKEDDVELTIIKSDSIQKDRSFAVRFLESESSLDLSDSVFEDVDYLIEERKVGLEDLYNYTVGVSKKMDDLYYLYRELTELGFDARVIEYQIEEQSAEQVDTSKVVVFFGVASSSVSEYYEYNIKEFTKNLPRGTKLKIEGFSDPTGNKQNNQVLSQKRAKMVKEELLKLGFKSSKIDVVGMGETGDESGGDQLLRVYRKVEITIVE